MDRMCFNADGLPKKRFNTRAEAKAFARGVSNYDGIAQPFRCPNCGYFHNGHYPKSKKARAKLRANHRKDRNAQ